MATTRSGLSRPPFLARQTSTCDRCNKPVDVGARLFPIAAASASTRRGGWRWVHFECAPDNATLPLCKHWQRSGQCSLHTTGRCSFRHPERAKVAIDEVICTGRQSQCCVIFHHLRKAYNIGSIVRSAVAFGATRFCFVQENTERGTGASHAKTSRVTRDRAFWRLPWHNMSVEQLNTLYNPGLSFERFDSLRACCDALRSDHFSITGIEIDRRSIDVCRTEQWCKPRTALLLGREGTGLSEESKALCDGLVVIEQFATMNASLSVVVAASIVLHHFASWAKQQDMTGKSNVAILGDKFVPNVQEK